MAILKKEHDLVELNALNETLTSNVRTDIQQIDTNFGPKFTEKTRKIFEKYPNLLTLPTDLPPNRPGFDNVYRRIRRIKKTTRCIFIEELDSIFYF